MTSDPDAGTDHRAAVRSDEPKLFLVVSNNTRNSKLPSVLTVRLTTSTKPEMASIVVLPGHEGFQGRVLCDDIAPIYDDEIIGGPIGALSRSTMAEVDRALKAALALS